MGGKIYEKDERVEGKSRDKKEDNLNKTRWKVGELGKKSE